MPKLNQLFDMQKIAGNKELSSVIDETHSRYGKDAMELDDDMMELVAAGRGENASTVEHKCPTCNELRLFNCYSGGRSVCTKCGTMIIM